MSADVTFKAWNTIERNGRESRDLMFNAAVHIHGDLSMEERSILCDEISEAISKAAGKIRICKFESETKPRKYPTVSR